jgi:drug/metabolite transporter (DMT)-like permease
LKVLEIPEYLKIRLPLVLKKISADGLSGSHDKGTRTKALIALGLVSFLWGTTWIASREGVKHMPALQLAAIRQFIGGMAYVVFFMAKGRAIPRGKEWITILILTFLNFILSNTLSTWGLKYISAGLGSIIGATFPLWLVLIILFKSRSSLPKLAILGFILGFAGICVIFYEHLEDFFQSGFRFGIFLSVSASISWAFGTLYTKKKATDFNPYFSLGLQMAISGIILYVITWGSGLNIPIGEIPRESWIAIIYLVIFSSILTFIAYLYALQHLPASRVSIYAYINPVVAVLIGSLFFGEKFTLIMGVGGLITLLGVYLVNDSFRRKIPEKVEEKLEKDEVNA